MPKRVQELKPWSRPAVPKALYYEQRFGWIEGVNLDPRLAKETRRVLTVLALEFRNKKTGECFPSMRRLAMWCGLGENESAIRATRRALEEGEKLGWIRRHARFGGDSKYNQSNSYEFLVPEDVTPAGLANVKLQVVGKDGRWSVTQVKDGVEICGPFKTQEAAETWMGEHGPPESRPDKLRSRPDKVGVPTGQNRGPDRTPVSGNNIGVKHGILEHGKLEHPVLTYCRSDERHRPVDSKRSADRQPAGSIKNLAGSRNPADRDNPAGSMSPPGSESLSAGCKQEPLPQEAAPPSPDIEALAETVRGGYQLLAPLLHGSRPMSLGALIQCAKLTEQEVDIPGFLKCGAVYREKKNGRDLIYPTGCIRSPDGSYDLPGYDNRYVPRREDEIADCIRRLEDGKDVSHVAPDILEEARRQGGLWPDDDDTPF
jgi:hypothetical protein